MITRLIAVVTRLSQSASSTTGDAIAIASDPSRIGRTTRVTTGSPRKSANSAGDGGERPLAPADVERRGLAPDGPRRRVAPAASVDHDGGRNPKLARIAWPSGPANQSRNAVAAAAFFEALTTTPS